MSLTIYQLALCGLLAALLLISHGQAASLPSTEDVSYNEISSSSHQHSSLPSIDAHQLIISSNSSSEALEGASFLTKLVAHIFEMFDLKQVVQDIKQSKTTPASCYSCKFGIALVQHLLEFGKGKEELAELANTICVMLRIEQPRVCKGIVEVFKDEFVTVVTKLALAPSEICGIILGDSCSQVYNPLHNWTIALTPFPKPPVAPKHREPSGQVLRVLQLSDTHIDPYYETGGDALCGEPLCCRASTRDVPIDQRSGYWGDYRDCDLPLRTLEATLEHIRTNHNDLDYIIWTGDIPAHDVWNQTKAGQLKLIRTVTSLLDKHLGHLPLLPALGNHESAPVNSFPRPEIKGRDSIAWLYDELELLWKWLPNQTQSTIKKGAYYATYIKPGLKVISLNMNYCNNQNWWLLLNTTDPADELTWLINELQTSELLGDKVHVIGHIPPGSNDCFQIWSQNYNRIVNRYESTIVAQFFGHTHQDEFELFYEEVVGNDTAEDPLGFAAFRPTNLAFVSPSVTTFGGVNPGYRIYTIDAHSYEVLDHETYFANLTEANILGPRKPLWFELAYEAKSAYGLHSLEPAEWHRLVLDMVHDEDLFQKFYQYFFNKADYMKPCSDQSCKADILCRLITAKAHDTRICQRFLRDLDDL